MPQEQPESTKLRAIKSFTKKNLPTDLAPFRCRQLFQSLNDSVLQPSRMLRTYFEIVPFWGRQFELDQLRKWRDGPAETAVQLIYGPGGQGKTRLATHLARMWAIDGWTTFRAFAHGDFSSLDTADVSYQTDMAGTLIIADYAERWEIRTCSRCCVIPPLQQNFPYACFLVRPAGNLVEI